MADLSRRSLLAAVPAAAVTMATPVAGVAAVAVAAGSDPISAAIASHRAAWEAFGDTCDLVDAIVAQEEGRTVTNQDEAIYEAASDAEQEAFRQVLICPCRMIEEIQAKASYLLTTSQAAHCLPKHWHVKALLTSMAGGANG